MEQRDYDELSVWQDTLDEIMAGRDQGLTCPYCQGDGLDVEKTRARLLITCHHCGKRFEGRFTAY
jgi:transcription elongation factor Elf1